MLLLLAILGVALIAFGALVLLRFPDRPGGNVRLLGFQVSSIGAGLPLIALGVLMVVVAVVQQPEDGQPATADDSGGGGGQVAPPPPDNPPACIIASFFVTSPKVSKERQRALAAGAEDVDVLGPEESKREEFGLVLTDQREVVGAAKLTYDVDAKQFGVDAIVDAGCKPVNWRADDVAGSNPSPVGQSSDLILALDAREYRLELKPDGEVEMELHRFVK